MKHQIRYDDQPHDAEQLIKIFEDVACTCDAMHGYTCGAHDCARALKELVARIEKSEQRHFDKMRRVRVHNREVNRACQLRSGWLERANARVHALVMRLTNDK